MDVIPTRSMLRELESDQRVVREGREFLDQKRMLLATEILRRLGRYRELKGELDALQADAAMALAEAVARHGLDGVLSYPAALHLREVEIERDGFLGVPVTEARLTEPVHEPPLRAVNPSPEARRCARAFRALLERSAEIAALSSSLERLRREYRQTERRTRALEDVLEPELDVTIDRVRDELDEQDQEEAVRARRHLGDRF